MLKSASRARSLVGRTVSPAGASKRRPRYLPPTIRMRRVRFSELLGQHLFWDLGDLTAGQIAELEWSEGEPDQPCHGQPEMIEHAAPFAVLALAQRQRDPGVATLQALEAGLDRAIGHAIDCDPLPKRREPVRI